jgi:hypothetical protein
MNVLISCIDTVLPKIPLQVVNLFASLETDDLQSFANFVHDSSCLFNLIIVGFD